MRVRGSLGKTCADGRRRQCLPRSTLKNTMNITTSRARYILASMLALATIACGGDPCLPTINADTSIIPPAEECFEPGSDASAESGDVCPMLVDVMAWCAETPAPGTEWGACFIGSTCNTGLSCRETGLGNVCLAECTDCECGQSACAGGTCDGASCIPACDETSACPSSNMICDVDAGLCVHTAFATICEIGVGEVWGPCDETGGCLGDLQCDFGDNAWVCVDACISNDQCGVDTCDGGQTAPPLCALDGLCIYPCAADVDCASGQTCTPQGCMWPIN